MEVLSAKSPMEPWADVVMDVTGNPAGARNALDLVRQRRNHRHARIYRGKQGDSSHPG